MDPISKSLHYIWYPCAQMKDYEQFKPIEIQRASGSYIELKNGKKIIDAISSWWCKSLGHKHPRLVEAMRKQMEQFEHVMLPHTTHNTIAALSEKLAQLLPPLNKVMFASDGSSAVEIALKMSLHARKILGEKKRTKFIALENSYHGETAGCLSVSDLGLYRAPYEEVLFGSFFIPDLPYVQSTEDFLWKNCDAHWTKIESALMPYAENATAVIVEPLVQGAGNMKIYSQDLLKRLRRWTERHGIHLIADEIMTGFGRTGSMLASEQAGIVPDFLCLSKGLTSGWLPMSVMLTKENIYNLFYANYSEGKNFLHSHTYSGNALAACVALETLKIFEEEPIVENAKQLGNIMKKAMADIAEKTQHLKNVRHLGAIVAADLIVPPHSNPRVGFEIYKKAMEHGALLRPIGNTIYWMPPLNSTPETMLELKEITLDVIHEVMRRAAVTTPAVMPDAPNYCPVNVV